MFKFYRISNEYIDYLRKKDSRVMDKNGIRINLGVVLEINGINYYVPLSDLKRESKEKYFKNDNEILETFSWNKRIGIIYNDQNKKIALLRYDYMLPVPNSELKEVDRNTLYGDYKIKVENEYKYCNSNKELIKERALEIYIVRTSIIFNNTDYNPIMKSIDWEGKRKELKKYKDNLEHPKSGSCDFKILETALNSWVEVKNK